MNGHCSHHAGADQILDGSLNHHHIDPTRQIQISPEQVAVAVLLGGQSLGPSGPRAPASPSLILDPIQRINHRMVSRQCVLYKHIPNQNHKVLVRQLRRPIPQSPNLIHKFPVRQTRIRQEILRLPALVHRLQQRQHMLTRPTFQRLEHVDLFRRHWVRPPILNSSRRCYGGNSRSEFDDRLRRRRLQSEVSEISADWDRRVTWKVVWGVNLHVALFNFHSVWWWSQNLGQIGMQKWPNL